MDKDIQIQNINTSKALGIALKRLRKKSNMSQDQLAKVLDMRQATISDIENGRGTLDSLFKVIQALKINLSVSNNSNSSKNTKNNSKTRSVLNLLND